jgi:hypothetical protein
MLCNRCGYEGDPDYVHGHVQCKICKQVIADCCQGEVYDPWTTRLNLSEFEKIEDKG